MINFYTTFVLKSGKVLTSDEVEVSMDYAEKSFTKFNQVIQDDNSKGVIYITRNGKALLIPVASVDYIEFTMETLDESTP